MTKSGAGNPLPEKLRSHMEQSFGTDLSGVRVHHDATAASMSQAHFAQAFTHGRDIYFDQGRYRPETRGGVQLLAHELAHVVQQGAGSDTATVQTKSDVVTAVNDPAEQAADAAAEAVMSGKKVPPLGRMQKGQLSRSIRTFGGTFDTKTYAPWENKDDFGAEIDLEFMPGPLVPANSIVKLVQTVKSMRGNDLLADDFNQQLAVKNSDDVRGGKASLGWGVDMTEFAQRKNDQEPKVRNTSPIYKAENIEGNYASKLGQNPKAQAKKKNKKKKNDEKKKERNPLATLQDRPFTRHSWSNNHGLQDWHFEVAAIIVSGPGLGTYLGSVGWGFRETKQGGVELNPKQIQLISEGVPSQHFRDAARAWNKVGKNGDLQLVKLPTMDEQVENELENVSPLNDKQLDLLETQLNDILLGAQAPLSDKESLDPSKSLMATLIARVQAIKEERVRRLNPHYQRRKLPIAAPKNDKNNNDKNNNNNNNNNNMALPQVDPSAWEDDEPVQKLVPKLNSGQGMPVPDYSDEEEEDTDD